MKTHKKVSVIPIYLVGLTWLVYALLFPLYAPIHYILCAGASVLIFIIGKAIFPDKVYQTVEDKEKTAQEKAQELSLEFPLLETVEVYQHIPSTVIVRVQPAVATYCVQTTAGWATLSEQFKVMELSNTQPAGLLSILGLDVQTPVPGTFLQLDLPDPTEKPAEQTDSSSGADSSASSAEATPAPTAEPEDRSGDLLLLRQILKQLEEEGLLDSVTQLDMTDLSQISVTYDGRIKVLLGTSNNLTYKIQFTQAILTSPDGLSATDTGTLDVSNIREDGTIRPVFSPD